MGFFEGFGVRVMRKTLHSVIVWVLHEKITRGK